MRTRLWPPSSHSSSTSAPLQIGKLRCAYYRGLFTAAVCLPCLKANGIKTARKLWQVLSAKHWISSSLLSTAM